jgi:hypothetical protein
MNNCGPDIFGADPARVKWQVVRGDTSSIRIEFLENDEVSHYNISDWEFSSTAYDSRGDVLDELETAAGTGYVDITAPASMTALWGRGYSSVVNELIFDLQVTLNDGTIWTPVLGTITVFADISGTL